MGGRRKKKKISENENENENLMARYECETDPKRPRGNLSVVFDIGDIK